MSDAVTVAACTIVSPNYVAFARTLAASYLAQHPGQTFYVLIVSALKTADAFAGEGFTAVLLSEIGLKDVQGEAMKYDILELNTNVKPRFMRYLLGRYGLKKLVYLDPDIFVYAPLTPVFEALDAYDAVLTPHLTSPIDDDLQPGEQEMLYNGTYNLGFFGVRNTAQGQRILGWWERRCLDLGFSEGRTGLFVDQKWMNLAPGLFEGVGILRDAGCNMAYWNLHERRLDGGLMVNGVPLRFFHFSGIVVTDAGLLSKNTNRFTLADRPDLQGIFADYKAAVVGNKDAAIESVAYGFGAFSDGTAVTRLARRIYAMEQEKFAGDPFDAAGPWAAYCRKAGLTAGKEVVKAATWREFKGEDKRVQWVHRMLKAALRVLGPNRYELLMRYVGHIAVLRNQSVFLGPGKDI